MGVTLQELGERLADQKVGSDWYARAQGLLWAALEAGEITYGAIFDTLYAGCQDGSLGSVMVYDPARPEEERESIFDIMIGTRREDHGRLFITAIAAVGIYQILAIGRRQSLAGGQLQLSPRWRRWLLGSRWPWR